MFGNKHINSHNEIADASIYEHYQWECDNYKFRLIQVCCIQIPTVVLHMTRFF